MFKANLINSPQYYKVRRFALIMFLYPLALVVVVVAQLPWYWAIPVFLLAMGIDLWKIKVDKQARALSTGQRIEISDEAIHILSDSGEVVEALKVADASGILVKDAYGIPGDTLSGLFKEVQGKTLENFIIYQRGAQKVRYDFVIESNYMIEQLKKIIQNWQAKGIAVGRAGQG